MLKIQSRYLKIAAGGVFAAGLIGCASEGDKDNVGPQTSAPQTSETATAMGSVLANKEAELRAARGSAGAARDGVKSCFDSLGACAGDGGAPDQACLDQLKGCLPVAPPAPIGCPTLPEPTAEQIAAADDAVGAADDLAEDVINTVGPVIDDLATQVDEVIAAILDGGIPLPPPPSGGPGRGDRDKGTGRGGLADAGGGFGGGFPPFTNDGGVGLPPIPADASIGGGELCGVPLPVIPIGELKACGDAAAAELAAGGDVFAVAESALTCVATPFAEDIAALCGDATSTCAQPDAPPNICAHIKEICSELTGP
jgi:hypothetical protein